MTAREYLEILEAFLRADAMAVDATLAAPIRNAASRLRTLLRAELEQHAAEFGIVVP